jgi:Mlc titration factor MtfA (ptsG expression regulator)
LVRAKSSLAREILNDAESLPPMSIWDILAQGGQELLKHAAEKLQFRLPNEPVPAEWRTILAANVPLSRHLTGDEQDRLLRVARLLLEEVPFEGCGGLTLTDEIRVSIAANAALLVFRLPFPRFTKLIRVLVYPDTFVPKKYESPHDREAIDSDPSLGQALMSGVIVLSWEDVRRDVLDHPLRGNVVLHEMAHILDAEDGLFDGTPVFDDMAQGAEWAQVLDREFGRLQDAVNAGEETPLDDYGARNHAEFFAVATEAFYCQPDRLRERLPALYDQLQRFFRS